jgi:hypothetical protein
MGAHKGKKWNQKPCIVKAISEHRDEKNARLRKERGEKRDQKAAAKHARRRTLGYRARQLKRNKRDSMQQKKA